MIDDHVWSRLAGYDIYLGMLWRRMGTPTGRWRSGTEAESRYAYERFRRGGSPRKVLSIGLGSFLVALALVVAVDVGSAIAIIPNQGIYSVCLSKATGEIRVINYPKAKCVKGERLIRWSKQGPTGAQGPAGPADWNAIPNLPAGFADGLDNEGVTAVRIIYTEGTSVDVPPGESCQTSAQCPPGSIAVAGGLRQGGNSIRVTQSNLYPTAVDTWYVSGFNTGPEVRGLVPYVTCLEVTPSGALTIAKKGVKVAKVKQRDK